MMAVVPFRWIISLLGMYACALVYTQRAGMAVAIVAMTTTEVNGYPCNNNPNGFNRSDHSHVFPKPEFDWNAKLQGIVLSSQFWLYSFIFTPTFVGLSGPVSPLIGPKWVAFLGALGPCLLSLITPVVTRSFGAPGLIVIRSIMGAFQGCVYGPLFGMLKAWFPVRERTNANNGLLIGSALGATVMFALAGWLCQTQTGWPLVFYVNALLYIPWMVLWVYFATNCPDENRHLDDEELRYIKERVTPVLMSKRRASLFIVLTSVPVLCSLITKMCVGFCYFLLITKLPAYLASVHHISLSFNGLFNGLASLSHGLLLTFSRPLANLIIRKSSKHLQSIAVRKLFQAAAMISPAICMALVPVMGSNTTAVTTLLFCAMLLSGMTSGGEVIAEYAPNSAGTVFGFANILAFAMGMAVPYLVGILLDTNGECHTWNGVFYGSSGVLAFGAAVFVLFSTDKQQPWDRLDDRVDAESTDDFKSIKRDTHSIAGSDSVIIK